MDIVVRWTEIIYFSVTMSLCIYLKRRRLQMFGLGMPEILVILLIVVIIFGAGKLPEIGSGIGRGIKNFKDASKKNDTPDKIEDPNDKKA